MSLTQVSNSMIVGAVFNVLDYIPQSEHDAIRNHTSTYDCLAAFDLAVADARSYDEFRGATIYVPAGTYNLSSYLNLYRFNDLVGEGRNSTVLKWTQNEANGAGIVADYMTSVSGLNILNVGTNNTTSIGICSYNPTSSEGASNGSWVDLYVDGWGYGLSATLTLPPVYTQESGQVWNSIWEKIYFVRNRRSIDLRTTGCNNVRFQHCYFKENIPNVDGIQVYINGAMGVQFEQCGFESPDQLLDLQLEACLNVSIKDCYFEPAHGIYADTCPGLAIESCVITQVAFSGAASSSFLRASTNSLPEVWDAPIYYDMQNCVSRVAATGDKFWVNRDDTNVIVRTENLYSTANDLGRQGQQNVTWVEYEPLTANLTEPTWFNLNYGVRYNEDGISVAQNASVKITDNPVELYNSGIFSVEVYNNVMNTSSVWTYSKSIAGWNMTRISGEGTTSGAYSFSIDSNNDLYFTNLSATTVTGLYIRGAFTGFTVAP